MRFRECMSKNEGVAGYVEAFWHVLSESQTAHMYQLLIIQCTSVTKIKFLVIWLNATVDGH